MQRSMDRPLNPRTAQFKHSVHVYTTTSAVTVRSNRPGTFGIALGDYLTPGAHKRPRGEGEGRGKKVGGGGERGGEGYMSIRAVRQTPYKKYNGTAPTERTDTVIPYRIAHVYVLESGLDFWPCTCTRRICFKRLGGEA